MNHSIPPPVPDFATERLRLRGLTVADAHDLHQAYGDAEAMRYWDAPPCRDVAETEQRIQRSHSFDATWQAAWAVLVKDDGSLLAWSIIMLGNRGTEGWLSAGYWSPSTGDVATCKRPCRYS